jgi:hypothetical protein
LDVVFESRFHARERQPGGQSIEASSLLKMMFLHFFIRKSGNGGWLRRCGMKRVVRATLFGVWAALCPANLK